MLTRMYQSIVWRVLLMTSCVVFRLSAFPSGGPSYSCRQLLPGHSNGTQQSVPPYRVAVSRQSLEAGGTTRVSIDSTTDFPFLGFICAVSDLYDNGNDTVGTMVQSPGFQQPELIKTLSCARSTPDTAITHTSKRDKWRVEFDWMSPLDAVEGQRYKLRCTVVQTFHRCWTDIQVPLTIVPKGVGNQLGGSTNPDTFTTPPRDNNSIGPGQNPSSPANGRNSEVRNANTTSPDPGNNSVSPGGTQRQFDSNSISFTNNLSITGGNDNNRRLGPQGTRLLTGGQGIDSSQTARASPVSNTAISGGRRSNRNNGPLLVSPPSTSNFNGDLSRRLQNRQPLINTNRQPEGMNQIANPRLSLSNSMTSQDGNQVNTPPRLSDFERTLILELIAMGINPFSRIGTRPQSRVQDRVTNNIRRGDSNNIQRPFQFSFPNTNTNRNPVQRSEPLFSIPSRNTNTFASSDSGFQNAGLVRSDTRVFDPMSLTPIFRSQPTRGNPNSRGLFQSLQTRMFNPDFRRIRGRSN